MQAPIPCRGEVATMNAEVIAVGSELLWPGRHESNTLWLSERLDRLGYQVVARTLVSDDAPGIAAAVTASLQRSRVVIVTGGLGPTEDDRTRQGLALALDRPLVRDETRVERIRSLFNRKGRRFAPEQARQAERPAEASWIENDVGTAPGLLVERGEWLLCALPGVPAEMKPMFDRDLAPRLAARGGRVRARRSLKIAGRTESSVDRQLRDLYSGSGMTVSVLIGHEGIEVHLSSAGSDAADAERRVSELDRLMTERLGDDLYGRDDETLPQVVGRELVRRGRSVATAESCTAGLLAATLTREPGSSAWFRGGLVVYSDDLKRELAGVRAETLTRHGAVSLEVAEELASGVRDRCGSDYGIGITGIAGPGGGAPGKPVGLVHLALAHERDVVPRRLELFGDRELVRRRTVVAAMDLLRRQVQQSGDPA